ncbi:MAG: hypothetical protein JXA82_17890 [Sedimentisphaerales bacterium]|nr:hypothetical protein [Sedimentisphaerales bacterium]
MSENGLDTRIKELRGEILAQEKAHPGRHDPRIIAGIRHRPCRCSLCGCFAAPETCEARKGTDGKYLAICQHCK